MEPLAHSGRRAKGIPAQSYAAHIGAVRSRANSNAAAALRYRSFEDPAFRSMTDWAAAFHDLGKLEPANQEVLRTKERGSLPVNHVDAGVAHLANQRLLEAGIAVYGHHIGLCNLSDERAKDVRGRQDSAEGACRDYAIKLSTDRDLPELVRRHHEALQQPPQIGDLERRSFNGLERRLFLSCLVDADHSDTAQNYGEQPTLNPASTHWEKRLASLDVYVDHLGGSSGARSSLRTEIYRACRSAPHENLMWACDSPVGSGKTTAIMAYLLKAAIALNLRHIFVVLPYTNIVNQAVDVYRRALVLQGEDPQRIVAAHHHQAEFESPDLRYLSTLWDCPIIVTTAVQFFETLGASQTPRLRKLHQLPGSAVFIDEAHAAMPIHLWPFMWDKIKSLAQDWTCRFVLASGSLSKFWENPRIFEGKTETLPSMVPASLRDASSTFERQRVQYRSRPNALSLMSLCDWIREFRGPRLVVLNTVQSAAVVANELRNRGVNTYHLSTALAPIHRDAILKKIKTRLLEKPPAEWVLVATSCVEAGVDFSFANAFRERCRAASLVQIGGRVNRHGEKDTGTVWDFTTNDSALTHHPDFKHSQAVVREIFIRQMWDQDLTSLMTYALQEEFKRLSGETKIRALSEAEQKGHYPDVAQLTRLITADQRTVVIDKVLISSIRDGVHVSQRELLLHSVQLWTTKIKQQALSEIGYGKELYAWEYDYDPDFLGIMAGVLKSNQMDLDGYAIV